MRRLLTRLLGTTFRQAAAVGLLLLLVAWGGAVVTWMARYELAVNRLREGVGDTFFYTADGKPWFRMDEQRQDVPLHDISPNLQRAVIAIEDHRFFLHPGIDPIALARASVRNLRHSEAVEGGSTITQQLARTLFLSNSRTWGRKLKEAGLAWMLERQLTKQQILELYLNRVYLSAGVYGVEPMSRRLFGKPSKDVTLPEAALIAGLIRAPSALSPWSNLDAAVRRSHVVLARMREERVISAAEERQAARMRVAIRPYPRSAIARSGYAKEYLRQRFRDRFGGSHPPDWQVHTTFDRELQLAAEQAVDTGLQRLNRRDLQAALVVVDPETGGLLALVGGRDFGNYPYNRATRSHRQPGSAFKPFVYAAALERGLSPISMLRGLNSLPPEGPAEWAPHNARGESPDELTLRAALLASDNRAAVMLQKQVGSRPVLTLAANAGLEQLPDVPSLALGTGVVTPLELTLAYSMFPNGGFALTPRALTSVVDGEGAVAFEDVTERRQILSPESAFQMVSMLQDVVDRGTGARVRALGVDFPVAGKTGTTDDFKDAWFVGFSNRVAAGVWVGFDQPMTIARDAYAARIALPIWADFMRRAARARPPGRFTVPSGLRDEVLCSVTYLRPAEECPTYVEYFKPGDSIPNRTCPLHRVSLEQRASRAINEMLREIGERLKGIFKR